MRASLRRFTSSAVPPTVFQPIMNVTAGAHKITTVDCMPYNKTNLVASYMLTSSSSADTEKAKNDTGSTTISFVETNTSRALPHLEAAIKKAGLTYDHVRYIIVTHIHLDHAAGAGMLLSKCKNAKVVCDPRAKRHLVDPSRLLASAKTVYGEGEVFENECGEMIPCPEDRVIAMGDNDTLEIAPGRTLKFYHVEGHAKHHFAVHDLVTHSCFTGDSFGMNSYDRLVSKYGLKPSTFFPTTSPTDFDFQAAVDAINRISTLPNLRRVFPTHFGGTSEIAEAREQLLKILPLKESLRKEAVIMLATGVQKSVVDEYVKSGVRYILAQHLNERGLPITNETQQLFSDDGGDFKGDVNVNAMGLVHGAVMEVKKKGGDKAAEYITKKLQGCSVEELSRTFPFQSELLGISKTSTRAHILALLLRSGADWEKVIKPAAAAPVLNGQNYLEFVEESVGDENEQAMLKALYVTKGPSSSKL